jgi:galactose mutarotase-like enzyme
VGPNYRSVVLYSPGRTDPVPGAAPRPPADFIAIEPMVGITDSMNLAQKGIYKELQSIPPGGSWQESFWIRATAR